LHARPDGRARICRFVEVIVIRFFPLLVSLQLALGCATAAAQAADPALTRAEATRRALQNHPELRARTAAVEAAGLGSQIAALRPRWELVAELENVAGTGPYTGVDQAELTVGVERELESAAKRTARIRTAGVAVQVAEAELAAARATLAREADRRYLAVARNQRRIDAADAELARAQRTQQQVAKWVEAGRSPDSELLQAQIAVSRARLEQDDARHAHDVARHALAILWSGQDANFRVDATLLDTLPEVAPLEQLATHLPRTEAQARLALDAERLRAERAQAVAEGKPDLTLSIGARQLQGSSDQALVVGLRLPLGLSQRSALSSGRIDAQARAIDAQRELVALELRQKLYATYQELQHARHVVEMHRDEILPRAEQAVVVARRGYELGRLGFLQLTQAEQSLLDARRASADAAGRYHEARLDIDSLTAEFGVPSP
jgi:outer membrane protein, heavy metal efflux system